MLPYMALQTADVITSRVLRWGDCPGVGGDTPTLSKWHHKSLYRRKAGGVFHTEEGGQCDHPSRRLEDATPEAMKTEEGATRQRVQRMKR